MINDNVMAKMAGEVDSAENTHSGRFYRPNVDILENSEGLLLKADLPGSSSDRIDIKFEKGILTIHAGVDKRYDENQPYLLREYGVGDYYRTFQVSESIDAQRIQAEYADGVLSLKLPKVEAAKPRKINVSAK